MRIVTTRTPCPPVLPLLVTMALLVAPAPDAARAARWERLVRTGSDEVSLDRDSVRPAASGRLGVWLRFTPRGEAQRRAAAAEYGAKAYRLRLEYYEIDCTDDRAVLGMRDIMGSGGKRVLRQQGSGAPEAIVPGSELDLAARCICPVPEAGSGNDADTDAGDETATTPEQSPEPVMTAQARQRITEALGRTGAGPSDPGAWTELGNAYFDADMPREAIEAYNRSLALHPDNADVLNDQGAMYRQTGDIDRALKNFEKALSIDQRNVESLYNIGYVYAFDLHQIERARGFWHRYLELDRSSETASQVQSFIDRYGR